LKQNEPRNLSREKSGGYEWRHDQDGRASFFFGGKTMRREQERLIELTVEIGGHKPACEEEIKRVCMVEWAFRNEDFFHKLADDREHQLLEASALGSLYSGDDVNEIVHRIERAVWRANGEMCHVEVRAMSLSNPPEWQHILDEELQAA
jgi:hypothetical protein